MSHSGERLIHTDFLFVQLVVNALLLAYIGVCIRVLNQAHKRTFLDIKITNKEKQESVADCLQAMTFSRSASDLAKECGIVYGIT